MHQNLRMFGERIDYRCADAMKTARNLIPAVFTAELSAGMKRGHDGLKRRDFCLRMDTDRNTATVVCNAYIAVRQKRDFDIVRVSAHRLIAGVVEDLPYEVMQAVGTGCSDIHAGALAHRLKPLKDGNRRGIVRLLFRLFFSAFSHTFVAYILA